MLERARFRAGAAVGVLAALAGVAYAKVRPGEQRAAVVHDDALYHPIYVKYSQLKGQLIKLLEKPSVLDKLELKWQKISPGLLSIKQANQEYLKIKDAGAEFLSIKGTAQNALKLDGRGASDFIQGHGGVVTGELSAPAGGQAQPVLKIPGLVELDAAYSGPAGGGTTLTLTNDANAPLDYVTSNLANGTIQPGKSASLGITAEPEEFQVQLVLPAVQAVTLDIGQLIQGQNALLTAQALLGNL